MVELGPLGSVLGECRIIIGLIVTICKANWVIWLQLCEVVTEKHLQFLSKMSDLVTDCKLWVNIDVNCS